MSKRNIIVVGASAGGVATLVTLVKSLPEDFSGSMFVVLHVSSFTRSYLPEILSNASTLAAIHAEDGQKIKPGMIYIAPPDHHLILEEGRVVVTKGPKENRYRPSIDALFRSAAYVYGAQVIGIVLTGLLDDGTSGLWSVKRLGGLCIVQHPDDAEFPSMPQNVLQYVDVEHCVPVAAMGAIIATAMKEDLEKKPALSEKELKLLAMEVAIATKDGAFERGILDMGPLTPFTCPECHGALVQLEEGKIIRFRCHTGHAYTVSSLLAEVSETVEDTLWQAMRGLEEATMLLDKVSGLYKENGNKDAAAKFASKAKAIAKKARVIHDAVFVQEPLSEDIRFDDIDK